MYRLDTRPYELPRNGTRHFIDSTPSHLCEEEFMNKWSVVMLLALSILTSAMGLKALSTHSTFANGPAPMPRIAASTQANGPAPMPR